MNLRRKLAYILSKSNKGRLPSGYQEVEWIQSTRKQYIDMGLKYTNNNSIEIKEVREGLTNSAVGANPFLAITNTGSTRRVRLNSETFDAGKITDLTITYLNKNKLYIDGELAKTFSDKRFTSIYNVLLFARNSSSGKAEELSNAKIYYCKIWNEDTLVRDFIPCYRKSDKVVGMYDLTGSICPLTNSPFYINEGTGEFEKGGDV